MTKLILALALTLFGPASAIEIATGKMLGKEFDARSFYLRGKHARWIKT